MAAARQGQPRDGTSQRQREFAALDPGTVQLDDRDVEDYLAFATKFAERVIYKEEGEEGDSDWVPFFMCDPSAIIAAIQAENPDKLRDELYQAIDRAPTPQALAELVTTVAALGYRLERWSTSVASQPDLKQQIDRRIRANLARPIARFMSLHALAKARLSLPEVIFDETIWGIDFDAIEPDRHQSGEDLSDPSDLVNHVFPQLSDIGVALYNVVRNVIVLAADYFEPSLETRRDVEPHFALFIAFLRLFILIRDNFNKLTERHLDFFYKEVLGLKTKPPRPDYLHAVAELAGKETPSHGIDANTNIDAGKDADGNPLTYSTNDQLIVNRAQIGVYQTVFAELVEADDDVQVRAVKAAPIANSQDGLGAEIEDQEKPSWATLGSNAMPEARIGFALASSMLDLAGGVRDVTVDFHLEGLPTSFSTPQLQDAFQLSLTGAEEWIDITDFTVSLTSASEEDGLRSAILRMNFVLPKTIPAIVGADPEILGEDLQTRLPVMRVLFRQPAPSDMAAYDALRRATLANTQISLSVTGITEVFAQTDEFAVDPAKPFAIFGNAAPAGAHFYLRSQEAFEKPLSKVTLNLAWDQLPQSSFKEHYAAYALQDDLPGISDFRATLSYLQDGAWHGATEDSLFEVESERSKFDPEFGKEALTDVPNVRDAVLKEAEDKVELSESVSLSLTNLTNQHPREVEAKPWTPNSLHGFLRLQLGQQDFLHNQQIGVTTRQSLAMGRLPDCTPGAIYLDPSDNVSKTCTAPTVDSAWEVLLPEDPYTPTVKSLTFGYDAAADANTHPGLFSHVHIEPFGTADAGDAPARRLVPDLQHEGTLYLGVTDLKPGDGLSVLFQVAESTADTGVPTPDVRWSYLAGDAWEEFEEHQIVRDTTQGLIVSGVITFTIPRDIAPPKRRLSGDYQWLRAHVERYPGGVSELLAAHTQAVRATLTDADNHQNHLEAPLPAGSVKGLSTGDAAIAGLNQPYDSVAGRPRETSQAFYTRVAERLRHKGRAITQFDYERLVLERFDDVYKVKCINHTDEEHAPAPGHVLVGVIPDFTKLKAVDRLRPQVTVGRLEQITDYLARLNCPFVGERGSARLHVVNPRYQSIKVAFNVRFKEHIGTFEHHKRLLNKAINEFLSPWAYKDSVDITFGGRVFKSSIVYLVEQQDYVDYVTDFVMFEPSVGTDLDTIEAATPRSILVPVEEHDIAVLEAPDCPPENATTPDKTLGNYYILGDFELKPRDDEGDDDD